MHVFPEVRDKPQQLLCAAEEQFIATLAFANDLQVWKRSGCHCSKIVRALSFLTLSLTSLLTNGKHSELASWHVVVSPSTFSFIF